MPRRCLVAAAQDRLRSYGQASAVDEHRRRLLRRATGRVLDLSRRPDDNRAQLVDAKVHEWTGPLHAGAFEPGSFDTVVSVFTLCTVEGLDPMLEAIARWLTPTGQLLVLEHVRATGFTAMAQSLATPIQQRLAGGCRLDNDVIGAFRRSDLELTDGARFSARVAGSLPISCLAGVARPRARNRGVTHERRVPRATNVPR